MMQDACIVDLYCRVSTDPQEDNTSLDEQEQIGRRYCQEHGLIIGMIHREVFSGYQYREREKLDLMRERYRSGKIRGVVIRTLDRLSRSQVHNAILMEEMEHYEVTLFCVKEDIDDTPMGKFIRMILAFVAEMEREKIMDRVTTGRINKAKTGVVVSGNKAPYGYDWLYDGNGGKTVVVNEDKAKMVRFIFEEYAKGRACIAIARQLTKDGIPSPSGLDHWQDAIVLRILSDQRYTGTGAMLFAYQNRKTKNPLEPVALPDGTYPPIIPEELYVTATERRDVNRQYATRANREPDEYLLRVGFVKCGYCDKPMMAVKHRKSYTYRCTHNDLGHTNVILSKAVDSAVWQWLEELADHIQLIEHAVQLATSNNTIERDVEAIEHSIAGWKMKATNYLNDLDDSSLIGVSRTTIRQALNNANRMVAQLEEERAMLLAGLIDKARERAAYEEILAWCKRVKTSRQELSYQQKRDFLRMLGVMVIVQNEKPFYEHLCYRIELNLPTIQELLAPSERVTSTTSSPEDIDVTNQLVGAGKLLDINVLDHLIIGNPRYLSLKEKLQW